MSDTPRTDAAEWEMEVCHVECRKDFGLKDGEWHAMAVPSSFARTLERELYTPLDPILSDFARVAIGTLVTGFLWGLVAGIIGGALVTRWLYG